MPIRSYSFLGHPIVTPVIWAEDRRIRRAESLNFRTVTVDGGHSRYRLTANFMEGINSSLFSDLNAHYQEHGESTPFNFPLIQHLGVDENLVLDGIILTVSINAAGGANQVVVRPNAQPFTVPAGTKIKFQNHDKIYTVLDGFSRTTTGAVTINIGPNLVTPVPGNTPIMIEDAMMRVRYTPGAETFTYRSGIIQRTQMELVEHTV